MTDALIRKVIAKYLNNAQLQYECRNTAYQIEQDLIDAIRNEYTTPENKTRMIDNRLILKDLIGLEE